MIQWTMKIKKSKLLNIYLTTESNEISMFVKNLILKIL